MSFDHGLGLARVFYFSQTDHSWDKLKLWGQMQALRDQAAGDDVDAQMMAAAKFRECILEVLAWYDEFSFDRQHFFENGKAGKLAPDATLFVIRPASERNILEQWFNAHGARQAGDTVSDAGLSRRKDAVKAVLQNIFKQHPDWRDEYGLVLNDQGEPDIYQAGLMLNLEKKYRQAEGIIRYGMIEHDTASEELYHDVIVIANETVGDENAQMEAVKKQVEALRQYMFADKIENDSNKNLIAALAKVKSNRRSRARPRPPARHGRGARRPSSRGLDRDAPRSPFFCFGPAGHRPYFSSRR